jgi:hypothetical protein
MYLHLLAEVEKTSQTCFKSFVTKVVNKAISWRVYSAHYLDSSCG